MRALGLPCAHGLASTSQGEVHNIIRFLVNIISELVFSIIPHLFLYYILLEGEY